VIYQGVSLDSLHPYGYSGGGINGIWLHLIEPLIVMDYTRQKYVGMLADSWNFRAQMDLPAQAQHPLPQRRAANLERRGLFHRAHENRQAQPARRRHPGAGS